MALDKPGGGGQNRRPSFSGEMVHLVYRGQEVVRAWPKKRKKKLHPATKERNEFFRQVQWAFKFSHPDIQRAYTEAVAGTPLLPRDLFLSAMAGRALAFYTPEGNLIVSEPSQRDVSQTLDFLESRPGAILFRGPDGWIGLAPGEASQVLTLGAELVPEWADAQGGGGGGPAQLMPQPPLTQFNLGNILQWGTTTTLSLMPAIAEAAHTIESVNFLLGGTRVSGWCRAVIYDNGPAEDYKATTTGATLVASGPEIFENTGPGCSFPLSAPFICEPGRLYLVGFLKRGSTTNTTTRPSLVTTMYYGSSTVYAEPPAVLPAMTATTTTVFKFWTA